MNYFSFMYNFHYPNFTIIWGRYPPEYRHDVDQGPLPFAIDMDSAFTADDDNDIHIT